MSTNFSTVNGGNVQVEQRYADFGGGQEPVGSSIFLDNRSHYDGGFPLIHSEALQLIIILVRTLPQVQQDVITGAFSRLHYDEVSMMSFLKNVFASSIDYKITDATDRINLLKILYTGITGASL